MNDALRASLAHLTMEPGVYRMQNAEGQVLYVGKAKQLKKRVLSYFNKQSHGPKNQSLVRQIAAVEVTVTRSETEALLLESRLIKTLRPKYNVLLRDDKSYPFLYVTTGHAFPRMTVLRSKKKPEHGAVFGPYPGVSAVRETLQLIQKLFQIRSCTDRDFETRQRPCLQYQMKRCQAPCVGLISEEAYRLSLDHATRFLQGKNQSILDDLALRMQACVDALAFEEAARLRDQIQRLRLVQEQQGVVQLRGDADVIVLEVQPSLACVQWVSVRDGDIVASERFFPKLPIDAMSMDEQTLRQAVFSSFIAYYYIDNPERIPALLLTDRVLLEQKVLESMLTELRGQWCHIMVQPRGVKARWLDFALNNLHSTLREHARSADLMAARYQALCTLLSLPRIQRMECFDISHTQGLQTVASCVVFDQDGPRKADYRCFNIEGIQPGDDYAAMEQVIRRRFQRSLREGTLPDVLIVDGGKGQVAMARGVLEALNIQHVTLLGIAKGPERKAGWERLILAQERDEITLESDSKALHLLQHIRDEAHRFAITAHRKKRQKTSMASSLDTIEGIGAKRRVALLHRFGGRRELAQATVEELMKVKGISRALALRVVEHFKER